MVKPVPPLPSHNSEKYLTERFSDHFINKITNLRENLAKCPSPSQAEINTKSCTSFFFEFNEITMETARTVIERSPSKSCLSHPMPTKTLQSCLNELLPVITTFVNSSLQEGVFPDALKEGLLHPKIKKTSMDKEDLNNFRPITNLAFLSKVIEKSVACQTRHYLTVNNLYPKLQAAYQQFQSTETALLRVHSDILRALDDKKEVILVLLDLSAAFDTIDHQVTYTIWIHWESSTVVHFVPTRPLPKSRKWKCKIGTQTSILWSPPKICFGAIVIHFILRPSWRSDQISRPWLHVFCWWLAALHHSRSQLRDT